MTRTTPSTSITLTKLRCGWAQGAHVLVPCDKTCRCGTEFGRARIAGRRSLKNASLAHYSVHTRSRYGRDVHIHIRTRTNVISQPCHATQLNVPTATSLLGRRAAATTAPPRCGDRHGDCRRIQCATRAQRASQSLHDPALPPPRSKEARWSAPAAAFASEYSKLLSSKALRRAARCAGAPATRRSYNRHRGGEGAAEALKRHQIHLHIIKNSPRQRVGSRFW